jgi:hypothetical protein
VEDARPEVVLMDEALETIVHDWWLDLDSIRSVGSEVILDGVFGYRRRKYLGHLRVFPARVRTISDEDQTGQLLVGEVHTRGTEIRFVSLGPRSELRLVVEGEWSFVAFMELHPVSPK